LTTKWLNGPAWCRIVGQAAGPGASRAERVDCHAPGRFRRTNLDAARQRRDAKDKAMSLQDRRFKDWRGRKSLREPRYLAAAAAAVGLAALGMWFSLSRQPPPQPTLASTEEPCATGPNNERVGFLRAVLLCSMDSATCKPDQVRVFRAQRSGSWSGEAMLIPDIPDGYVITGGDLIDPSPYRVTNEGFTRISVSDYTNASDYCTKHYWYYLHANWISSEPSDKARIKICVYYDKWPGAKPAEACPFPAASPPQ
jgi:hypothetical protein